MNTHILLINCPDERGLIYKITTVLFNHNLNIVSNGEFVERNSNYFFMRTEFSGECNYEHLEEDLKNALPGADVKLTANTKKNIVVMATKEYHCLSELPIRHHYNDINANIVAVISNYNNLQALAERFGVPYFYVNHTNKTREEHESQVLDLLEKLGPELIVLAKYMRILSSKFISRYNNRIINIHHSFLPAFIGANPYMQAYERGVKIIGATAHFVNDQLDEGPIISQNVITVNHTHSAKEMAQAGREVEKNVLATSLNLVLNERVFVYRNKTVIFE